MKSKLVLILCLVLLSHAFYPQQNSTSWDKLEYLIGNWQGEGSGRPGEGEGGFTFNYDLDQNILVRTSYSNYPETKDRPEVNHKDLMIIYCDDTGIPNRAIYFDNENHVINYQVTFPSEKDIVFTSERIPERPIFRLSYSILDENSVDTKFEMSQDGEKYFTYVEGKSLRIK